MKFLEPQPVNDSSILTAMSQNRRLRGRADLAAVAARLDAQYRRYHGSRGDPFAIRRMRLPQRVKDLLAAWYERPPAALAHIDSYRDQASTVVCPMCGSLHTTSLDHFLPKARYPEFHVYSRNLVPACNCNQRKGTKHRGRLPGERPLHPYYDDALRTRLVQAELGPAITPPMRIRICPAPPGTARALQFHVTHILKRTNVLKWLADSWINLLRHPHEILGLPDRVLRRTRVAAAIDAALRSADTTHGTPNNWRSMLHAGIKADPDVVSFLRDHMNRLHRGIIQRDSF